MSLNSVGGNHLDQPLPERAQSHQAILRHLNVTCLTASRTIENTIAPLSTTATVKALSGAMRVPLTARAPAMPRSNKDDTTSQRPGRECHMCRRSRTRSEERRVGEE